MRLVGMAATTNTMRNNRPSKAFMGLRTSRGVAVDLTNQYATQKRIPKVKTGNVLPHGRPIFSKMSGNPNNTPKDPPPDDKSWATQNTKAANRASQKGRARRDASSRRSRRPVSKS